MNLTEFKGLNNVSDPLRLKLGWLTQADNVDITDSGALARRKGYSLAQAGAFTGAYSTLDFSRMYVVIGGLIKDFIGNTLATLTSDAPMFWCEVNELVFFNNGIDSGIIRPDNGVLPWRESALRDIEFLDAAGNAVDALLDPLPLGTDVIQHWKGRIYAAQYMAAENQTVIWFSQPLGYHLFALERDFILVPGRVTLLAPAPAALLIGTDIAVHAYDGTSLADLAPYGVIPGQHWSQDDDRILFWTARGLCAALPFTNLTDRSVSVAPGVSAGGTLMCVDGQKRYVVALQQGGSPFNAL